MKPLEAEHKIKSSKRRAEGIKGDATFFQGREKSSMIFNFVTIMENLMNWEMRLICTDFFFLRNFPHPYF